MITKKEFIKLATFSFITSGLSPIAMFTIMGYIIGAPEVIGSFFYVSMLVGFFVMLGIYLWTIFKINKMFEEKFDKEI